MIESGYSESLYGDESVFKEYLASRKIIDENTIRLIRDEYKDNSRRIINDLTEIDQKSLIDDNMVSNHEIIYVCPNTNTIILNLTKERVLSVIDDERVYEVSVYDKTLQQFSMNFIPDQIRVGYGSLTNPGIKDQIL